LVTLKTEKSNQLVDGAHSGIIRQIDVRTVKTDKGDFEVVDVHIESEKIEVKAGYFARIYPNSELGKLLVMFGFHADKFGIEEVDLDKYLIGKKIQFKTETSKAANGRYYSNVVITSIMPMQ
jgi:hypothetical protein